MVNSGICYSTYIKREKSIKELRWLPPRSKVLNAIYIDQTRVEYLRLSWQKLALKTAWLLSPPQRLF